MGDGLQKTLTSPKPPVDLTKLYNRQSVKISIAGNVDDGKSTFIGRLLYDTGNVKKDIIGNVSVISKQFSSTNFDFALLVDGLKKEVEQGITINVCFRYIYTENHKITLIDTPGHLQYFPQAFYGVTLADSLIIICDISKELSRHTLRFLALASLLNLKNVLIFLNKVDRTGYNIKKVEDYNIKVKEVYQSILKEWEKLGFTPEHQQIKIIPGSALEGDNIIKQSSKLPPPDNLTVWQWINNLNKNDNEYRNMLASVNVSLRKGENRYYGIKLLSGTLKKGMNIFVYPEKIKTRVTSVFKGDKQFEEISAPLSATISIEDDIDLSCEHFISETDSLFHSDTIRGILLKMTDYRLTPDTKYIISNNLCSCPCLIKKFEELGEAPFYDDSSPFNFFYCELLVPPEFHYLPYIKCKNAGVFVIIDPVFHTTSGAGILL